MDNWPWGAQGTGPFLQALAAKMVLVFLLSLLEPFPETMLICEKYYGVP